MLPIMPINLVGDGRQEESGRVMYGGFSQEILVKRITGPVEFVSLY
jgi:hypothetical protein